jgi:hypothetical protein
MSGSPELKFAIGTGLTQYVNQAQLSYPSGIEWFKGILGQRISRANISYSTG